MESLGGQTAETHAKDEATGGEDSHLATHVLFLPLVAEIQANVLNVGKISDAYFASDCCAI